MSARQPGKGQFHLGRIIFSLLTFGLLAFGGCVQHQPPPQSEVSPQPATKPPPATPFLRIETGMHTAPIRRIDVDARRRYLATASDDKTARVWDLASGKLLQVLRPPIGPGNEGKLYAVAISPDGENVAVGEWWISLETNIYLFDRNSGRLQRRIPILLARINYLAYSADGRYLAAALGGYGRYYGGIRVYRSRDGVEVGQDTNYGGDSSWVEFDRAGRLVSTCLDGYIRLYDADFKLLVTRRALGGKQPSTARFSPVGDTIAVGFIDSTAVNVLSGTDLSLLYAPATQGVDNGDLSQAAWSPDGQWLYAGGRYYDKSGSTLILKWTQAGRGTYTARPSAKSTIVGLQALAQGQLVFAAGDPAFGIFDRTGRKLLEQRSGIIDYRFNWDNLRVSQDGHLVQFGTTTLTPNGAWQQRLAQVGIGRQLTLSEAQAGANQTTLSPPRTSAPGLTITDWRNTNQPRLNGQVVLWDPYETSFSLAITPDGKYFLLGTNFYLRLFNREGWQLWQVPVPGLGAWAVNISGDGRLAVAAFGDGTLRWYRLRDGKELLVVFPHADGKRWVLWTPEGFFSTQGDGEELIGYHLNQGPDREGEFIKVEQLYDLFYRPDLVVQSLADESERFRQNWRASGMCARCWRAACRRNWSWYRAARKVSICSWSSRSRIAAVG